MTEAQIRAVWDRFSHWFWILFFSKLTLRVLAEFAPTENVLWMLAIAQIPIVFAMAYLMGSSAYRMTKKRFYWIDGIFGFFWFGFVGIFLGYFAVKQSRNFSLRKMKVNPYPQNAGFFTRLLD